tara:strand:+ start:4024 stop:5334 length:1311 start_codon:yes stop_codon:yes gene_type:complete
MANLSDITNGSGQSYNSNTKDPRDIPSNQWRSNSGSQPAGDAVGLMGNAYSTVVSPTGAYYPEMQAPQSTGYDGLLGYMGGIPLEVGSKFFNQAQYGMNEAAQQEYLRLAGTMEGWDNLSEVDRVREARAPQMENQLPHAYTQHDVNMNNLTESQKAHYAANPNYLNDSSGSGGALQQDGGSVPSSPTYGETGTTGEFKPYTVTTGATSTTYGPDGLSSELTGTAADLSQQAGQDTVDYATRMRGLFDQDVSGRASEIMSRQQALLDPTLAAQRNAMEESIYGAGRSGLGLAAETFGHSGGMVQPERLEESIGRQQAYATLASNADQQAMGERAQEIAMAQAAQSGMFSQYGTLAGLELEALDPALKAEIARQNYEVTKQNQPYQQQLWQAQVNRENYQPDPWLNAAIGLGTSYLGTEAGSGWLSGSLGSLKSLWS